MKSDVLKIVGLSLLIALVAYVGAWLHYCDGLFKQPYCHPMEKFGEFYGRSLRGSLFTGFLTLGGFLLSLKTFIVVNMKKEVFDNEKYKKEWYDQNKLDAVGTYFGPLQYLSTLLFIAIVCCVATAILQLTLGLFETTLAAAICLWAALLSILFLLRCLLLIRQNLNRMFEYLEPNK